VAIRRTKGTGARLGFGGWRAWRLTAGESAGVADKEAAGAFHCGEVVGNGTARAFHCGEGADNGTAGAFHCRGEGRENPNAGGWLAGAAFIGRPGRRKRIRSTRGALGTPLGPSMGRAREAKHRRPMPKGCE
jgi:hypothetical protein